MLDNFDEIKNLIIELQLIMIKKEKSNRYNN